MKYRYLVLFLFSSMNAMDYGKHKIVRRTNRPKKDSPQVKKNERKKTSEDLSGELISIAGKITQLDQEISVLKRERGRLKTKLSKVSVVLQQLQMTDSDVYDAGKVRVVLQRLFTMDSDDSDAYYADNEKEDDEN